MDFSIVIFSVHKVGKHGLSVVVAAVYKIQIKLPIIDDGWNEIGLVVSWPCGFTFNRIP